MDFYPLQKTFISTCGQEEIQIGHHVAQWARLGWFQPQVSTAFSHLTGNVYIYQTLYKQDNCKPYFLRHFKFFSTTGGTTPQKAQLGKFD